MSEDGFPLVVWLATEEGQAFYESEKARLEDLRSRLREKGSKCFPLELRINSDGLAEALVHNADVHYRRLSVQEAINYAQTYGTYGYYLLDDFEEFLEGSGRIVYHALWELGFRPHKTLGTSKWVKKGPDDEMPDYFCKPKLKRPQLEVRDASEFKRLNELWIMPNAGYSKGNMIINAAANNMIYAYKIVNPFGGTTTESMLAWAAQFKVRGHLANKQDGFKMNPSNITLGEQKGVYILVTRADESQLEVIWPTTVSFRNFHGIAQDLVSRVRGTPIYQQGTPETAGRITETAGLV